MGMGLSRVPPRPDARKGIPHADGTGLHQAALTSPLAVLALILRITLSARRTASATTIATALRGRATRWAFRARIAGRHDPRTAKEAPRKSVASDRRARSRRVRHAEYADSTGR